MAPKIIIPRQKKVIRLPKTPTGIVGFDEITFGGLPKGRPALIAGNAGCGKTLFGMEFLARGAQEFNEPGVMVTFEESPEELVKNIESLGFDVSAMVAQKKLHIEYIAVERNEIEETGEYDLEGLFVRLAYAIDSVKAKRVVLDTIEVLFSGLKNESIVRSELRRLFRWLKSKGVTAVITGERGIHTLTRQGLEEYVADCVILLEHFITSGIATRRMRIVKYRGSAHGTDEYPFLINQNGISVLPITSLGLDHQVSLERISTGIPGLDAMLQGKGFYRGSSVLISGAAGTGKTTLVSQFALAACQRRERVLYFAFEESSHQIMRNMRSVGIELEPQLKSGRLKIHASRPSAFGLEMHLATIHNIIREFNPSVIIADPISNLTATGSLDEVKAMLVRLVDFIKMNQMTALFTELIRGEFMEAADIGISSLMDSWVLLKNIEVNGERNRGLYVLKARGIHHSNQIREFVMTPKGIELIDVYAGFDEVLTGSARKAREMMDVSSQTLRAQEMERKQKGVDGCKRNFEAEMSQLKSRYKKEIKEMQVGIQQGLRSEKAQIQDRRLLAQFRDSGKRLGVKFQERVKA